MTPKQSRFVREYLIDLDATKAAIRTGYSAKAAAVQGCRLLRNVQICAAIAKGTKKKEERSGITQDRVLEELRGLAFSDVTDYIVDEHGLLAPAPGKSPDVMRAVSSVKYKSVTYGKDENAREETVVEFRLWDKPGTLKLAGRHVGVRGFHDKMELVAPDDAKPFVFTVKIDNAGKNT